MIRKGGYKTIKNISRYETLLEINIDTMKDEEIKSLFPIDLCIIKSIVEELKEKPYTIAILVWARKKICKVRLSYKTEECVIIPLEELEKLYNKYAAVEAILVFTYILTTMIMSIIYNNDKLLIISILLGNLLIKSYIAFN